MSGGAVVTGLGIAAPNGLGVDAYWAAVLAGVSGIGRITRFDPMSYPVQMVGEVPRFVPSEHLPSRLMPQTDHMTRLALVMSDWALRDAGVTPDTLDEFDMGVVTASASGGFEFGQRELQKLWSKGAQHVSAYQSFAWFYAVNTGQVSIRHGMRGPSGVLVGEQAGGLDALGHARRSIRRGTKLVMTGAADSSLCPWGLVAQIPSGRLSTADDPARAYLPFDHDACGHVPGEGGSMMVMEDAKTALERGAPHIYGELAGYAATFDPPPGSRRASGLQRAVCLALADAGIRPQDIDAVFADAAGVPELDRDEADAISAVFQPRGVPVTAPKTMTGRLYSGGAPLDVATALLSMRHGVLPPTIGTTGSAVTEQIDLVLGKPRQLELRQVLVLARGYGGFNSAVVLRTVGNQQ